MLTIKDFMELVDYKITEGSDYLWNSFGPFAYRLDSWNGNIDGHTISIVFDTKTQEVYMLEAFDYVNQRAYRLMNPNFVETYKNECTDRNILDEAWEDDEGNPVKFIDLEVDEDFVEKAQAIIAGKEYSTNIMVPLTLEKDEMYQLMMMAHERNITLNQMVEEILQFAIESEKLNERLEEERHEIS